MSKVIGSFYFKATSAGNLLGEFTNNDNKEVITESVNKVSTTKGFIGKFQSIWSDITLQGMDLEIKAKKGSLMYELKWLQNGIQKYYGEGFIVDDILIGHYVQV